MCGDPDPMLVCPAQQAVYTLAPEEAMDYVLVWESIHQMLNSNLEAYRQHLWEVAFGPDYHRHLTAQKIRVAGL